MCLFVGPQSCWCLTYVSGFYPPEKWHRLDITKSPRFPLCPRSRPPGFSGANRYRKRRWNKPRCKGPMFKGNSPPVDSCWAWPRIIRIITIQSWLFLERKQSKFQQNQQPGQNKRGRFMNDLASFEQFPSYFLVTITIVTILHLHLSVETPDLQPALPRWMLRMHKAPRWKGRSP